MGEKVTLRDPRSTKIIELPSFKGSQVEILPYLLIGDFSGIDLKASEVEQGLKVLPKFIKSWNFTDDDSKDLPVTEEAIQRLPTDDVVFLFNEIKEFAEEQKKSSKT